MKKLFIIIFFCISSLFLTGCWDRYELEERANILGLAVDIAEEEEGNSVPNVTHEEGGYPGNDKDTLYKVTAQLAIPGKIKLGPEKGGEESQKTAWVLESYGYTMKDAMANLQQQLAEKIYYGHLQIIVVNKKIVEEDITDINDFLKREYEVRRTAWMVVSEEAASNIIQAAPPLETVPSLYLSNTLDNSVRLGKLPREFFGKFWVDLSDIGVDAVLPIVKNIDNDRIMVSGLAYFKGDKMVGRTNPLQIGQYLAVKGQNPGGYSVAIATEDGANYMVESYERNSKFKVKVTNGKPSAFINVEINGMIEEETQSNNLSEEKLYEIEQKLCELSDKVFNEFKEKLQQNQSDIYAIGARIRAQYPKYWNDEVKTDEKWSEIYKDMDIQIKVDFKIKRSGMEWK